ncbi:MAG: DoxX family protein [Planctomycetota bacterium]
MRTLLLTPLRFAVGYGLSPRVIGFLAATMLVILRLTIGWHFYSEGLEKYKKGNWTAKPFFANASGPFANHFRSMVWDAEGEWRLNMDATMLQFATFREQVAAHYGFDDQQRAEAQNNYSDSIKQFEWILQQNAADIEEFKLGRKRLEKLDKDAQESAMRSGVSSLGGQRETIRREWLQKGSTALSQIDKLWTNYEAAQNRVATSDQIDSEGYLDMVKPRTARMDTSVIDRMVPYFDMAVGICLLLGFFTPVAALAAAGFLGSVFLSQYPPSTGPGSTMYQLIEGLACLVLAATGAGRFAGLDFFLHLITRQSVVKQLYAADEMGAA